MIINQRDDRHVSVIDGCRRMLTAIRTAPKARGVDIIEAAIIEGDDLGRLSEAMLELHAETGRPVFERDARNILQGDAVIAVGTRELPIGLNCGNCGSSRCTDRGAGVPCAFNDIDLGIALGSAVSMAADMRLDTRVMYSAGMGALRLGVLPGCRTVVAIAVSALSKNPFFDR